MAILCTYDGVTTCDKKTWEEQKECPHAQKATWRDCCMHYCTNGRCDNIDAQDEARKKK